MEKTMVTKNENMTEFAREGAHYDNLTRAADYYGGDQVMKTVEEVGEFLAELGRALNGADNREKLVEETADVYNMLDQLCYMFGIGEEVQSMAEEKMKRTIKRMEDGAIYETLQGLDG